MGWTLQEYESQPHWFIQTLLLKWATENEVEKIKNKNAKQ